MLKVKMKNGKGKFKFIGGMPELGASVACIIKSAYNTARKNAPDKGEVFRTYLIDLVNNPDSLLWGGGADQ